MLAYLEHIILGIVQGVTEFLPISSTGHLVLFGKLFGLREAGLLFDTMLHFGTLLAVVVFYWQEVVHIVTHPFGKLTQLLIAGTIPTAIIGLVFEDFFDAISKTGQTIGLEFLATGVIIWAVESMPQGDRTFDNISYKDALIIGTLQGVAILPAISRSGLTIAGSLLRGIKRADAARFSFLLSLPAILGASVLQAKKVLDNPVQATSLLPMLAGTLFASLFGYAAIRWMVKLISSGSMKGLAVYVLILGVVIVGLQLLGLW
jgi:undecaprenyl-diphosphatase